jgi:hypothetical protein
VFHEDIVLGDCVVSKDVANKALNGQYVNLSTMLIQDEFEADELLSVASGKLKVSKRHGRPINSYSRWLSAIANYEQLLVTYPTDPQMYLKFAAYKRYIHSLQEKFKWDKVYQYDQKFRAELARWKSFNFHAIDTVSYTQVFDADSLKPQVAVSGRKCFRCHSAGHLISACPFPAQAPVAPRAQTSNEVCNKFNDGQCTFPNCRRQHVCAKCGGPNPKIMCQCMQANSNATAFYPSMPPPQHHGTYKYQPGASTRGQYHSGQDRSQ